MFALVCTNVHSPWPQFHDWKPHSYWSVCKLVISLGWSLKPCDLLKCEAPQRSKKKGNHRYVSQGHKEANWINLLNEQWMKQVLLMWQKWDYNSSPGFWAGYYNLANPGFNSMPTI